MMNPDTAIKELEGQIEELTKRQKHIQEYPDSYTPGAGDQLADTLQSLYSELNELNQ